MIFLPFWVTCYHTLIMAQTILVVEDNEELQLAYRITLEAENFTVLQAKNGNQGLEQAGAKRPDAILLDLNMPEMDGLTMLEELRKQPWGNMPVIILTSSDDINDVNAGLESKAQAYFVKDEVSLQQVVKTLKKLLQASS